MILLVLLVVFKGALGANQTTLARRNPLLQPWKAFTAGTNTDASEPSAAAQARQRMQAHLLLGAADGAELALAFLDGLGQGCIALQGRGG